MKKPIILFIAIFVAACHSKDVPHGEKFGAATIRGEWVEFTGVEYGEVSLPQQNDAKLDAVDARGNPLYFSSDIIRWEKSGTTISSAERHGFAIRFRAPEIAEKDYLFLIAEITPPREVNMGANKSGVIQGAFRFDSANSSRTEFIWFIPDEKLLDGKNAGKWKLSVFSGDIKIAEKEFTIK